MAQQEQMYFGSFCRGLAGEIIRSSAQTIDFDSSGYFTKDEKQALHAAFIHFKLLCVLINIMEKAMSGEIQQNNEENGRLFMQALQLAYEDNQQLGIEEVAAFEKMFTGYSQFITHIDDQILAENGFGFYACRYIAESFVPTRNTEVDCARYQIICDIATYLFDTLGCYFEETFQKVALICAEPNFH